MKTFLSLIFLVCISSSSFSQKDNWALGAGGIYNFQTTGIGAELRAYIPIKGGFAISPQFHYFFSFNPVQEYYAGIALQYSLFSIRNWDVYPLAAVYYNRWQNSTNFEGDKAKPNNVSEKVGIGIMRNTGCIKPFAEQRYDFKWKEFNFHLGILVSFGDCFGSGERCPAY